jgi:hypothetical protein
MTPVRVGVVAALAVLATLSFPAASLGGVQASGGTIATLAFSGQLAGEVKVARKWILSPGLSQVGCEKTIDKTSFNLFLYHVKLKLNGHETALNGDVEDAAIELFGSVQQYGDSESVANQGSAGGAPSFLASVGFNAYVHHQIYSWDTNSGTATMLSSGTITTNAKGTAGSLSATLLPAGTGVPSGGSGLATEPLSISGSWKDCQPFKG